MIGRVSLLTLLCLLFLARGGSAQGPRRAPLQPSEGKIVRSMVLEGNKRIPESVILVRIQTKVGQPFSEVVWGEDVRALYNLGFWNVRREIRDKDDGIELFIILEENPYVRNVAFKGVSRKYDKELKESLRIVEGAFLSDFALELVVKDAVEFYRAKGHHFAAVSYQLTRSQDEAWLAVFSVVEGPLVRVGEIRIEGNSRVEDDEILDVMETQTTGFLRRGAFVSNVIDQDVVAIRILYRHLSHLDARVDLEDLIFSADKSLVTIVLRVEEGPSYTIRSVNFEGNEVLSESDLRDLVRMRKGSPYLYEELRRDVLAIIRRYDELAYVRADIDPLPAYDVLTREVDLVMRINEGRDYRLGEIRIVGNILTRDKVIRRAFSLTPGDPFSIEKQEQSRNRLLASGYFDFQGGVEIETPLGDGEGIQDIAVRVREGRTGELRFAAGIGSDSGVIGQVSISKKNFDIADWPERFSDIFDGTAFVGGGQSIFLDLSPGTRVSQTRLGFREPSLFGTLNTFGVDLYRRSRLFRRYDVERTGFELSVGRTLEQFDDEVGVELSFRNELVNLHNLDVGFFDADVDGRVEPGELTQRVPDNVLLDAGKDRILGLKGTIRWEDLDHPLAPTSGHLATLTGEYTGNFLGGDVGMTRIVTEGRFFLPVFETLDERRHVLSLRSTLGWSEANDGTIHVPVYERFFAGGLSTLRGFEFRSVGPQQFDEPTGGEILLLNGAEYTFPLYERIFRGVLFADGGFVSENIDTFELNDYRTSIGFGLQFFIPFLGPTPFSIYFGFPFRKKDTDDRQVVTFTLGTLGF